MQKIRKRIHIWESMQLNLKLKWQEHLRLGE